MKSSHSYVIETQPLHPSGSVGVCVSMGEVLVGIFIYRHFCENKKSICKITDSSH